MEEKTNNPWSSVKKWEDFLYFCCPECNEKNQSKGIFIKHVLSIHPMAKMCLESIESEVQLKGTFNVSKLLAAPESCKTFERSSKRSIISLKDPFG